MPSLHRENTPLLGLRLLNLNEVVTQRVTREDEEHVVDDADNANDHQRGSKHALWALLLSAAACVISVYALKSMHDPHHISMHDPHHMRLRDAAAGRVEVEASLLGHDGNVRRHRSAPKQEQAESPQSPPKSPSQSPPKPKSPYSKVQTLSFQIYTGGAPAFVKDEVTGKEIHNEECKGLHSYGQPEVSDTLQCYLGLEDTSKGIHQRLNIMADAVNKAYDVSSKDESTLKIFLAPEFYFRGKDGAYEFLDEEEAEIDGACGDICHILKGLEDLVAHKRFDNWLFLFGTVIASESLPVEDRFDYQFYNFAPVYKGFDPATSSRIGKNFIVPKRYVSNMDFLTPVRHLTNNSIAVELLDHHYNHELDQTLMNPHASGHKRYDNGMWSQYKDELTELGYSMIEYGWFYMDGISFSVEICLDHLAHRAIMTYMADIVTGSKTLVPSSQDDSVEWVGIPKHQAQISLISSAGMDVTVASLALANGGHVFLQDGMEGGVDPHYTYGEDDCQPNQYEFFGGSQSVKRSAVISATDVTFEYDMNLKYKDYDLYPEGGARHWKQVLRGVFSGTAYQPKLTVYDPVDITLT